MQPQDSAGAQALERPAAASLARDRAALERDGVQVETALVASAEGAGKEYCLVGVAGRGVPVFCGTCSPRNLGQAIAVSRPELLREMATTYLEHVVPTFVGDEFDAALTASPKLSKLLPVFAGWLTGLAQEDLRKSPGFLAKHCPRMVQEIEGLCDGLGGTPGFRGSAEVRDALYAGNLAADLLCSLLSTGQLHTSFLLHLAATFAQDPQGLQEARQLLASAMEMGGAGGGQPLDALLAKGLSLGCDAFSVRPAKGRRVSFARDFQLPNGRVFQKAACLRILHTPEGTVFQSGAVGVCGGITAMRVCARTGAHLCIGVNMFRATWQEKARALVPTVPPLGYPAMAVLEAVAFDYGGKMESAAVAEYVAGLPRSTAWIFPIATDKDAAVVETLGTRRVPEAAAREVACAGIGDPTTRALVAAAPGVLRCGGAKAGCWYREGSAWRTFGHKTPAGLEALNAALFRGRSPATMPPEEADELCKAMLTRGVLHPPRWLGTNFFSLAGSDPDILVASNGAVVPLLRAFQMRRAPDIATSLTSKGIDWRYVRLYQQVCRLKQRGAYSKEETAATIAFMDPRQGCKYWWPRAPPADFVPGKLDIQGALCLAWAGEDAGDLTYGHKSGQWESPWVFLKCAGYAKR